MNDMSQVTLTEAQKFILSEWEKAKAALEVAKEVEMTLRNEVVAAFWPNGADEGTTRVPLANGYSLKYVRKINHTLGDNEEVEKALADIAALGPEGKFIAKRLVGWTPKLYLTEYRQLDGQYKKIIDKVITTKDAAPSLEIVEPKAPK